MVEKDFVSATGPRANQEGHSLRIELFQNLTKHAADVVSRLATIVWTVPPMRRMTLPLRMGWPAGSPVARD